MTGNPAEAARFGNLVASITIMKTGTGTASPEEVLAAEQDPDERRWPSISAARSFRWRCLKAIGWLRRESRATDREGGREWMLEQDRARSANSTGSSAAASDSAGRSILRKQRVALSTHVGGWNDFALTELSAIWFGVPVMMDNDANVGAFGEAVFGAGAGYDPLFYMTLSTGIGGGICSGRGVYRGADSYAGEIGHLTIRPDGPDCLCGANGCFERMCCGLWLERDYGKTAKELMQDPDSCAVM